MKEFFITNLKGPSDHTLNQTSQNLSCVTSNSTSEPDFNVDDIIQLRTYLHNWWLTLIQAPHYNREEFTKALHDLLNNPLQLTARRLQRRLRVFIPSTKIAVPCSSTPKPSPRKPSIQTSEPVTFTWPKSAPSETR